MTERAAVPPDEHLQLLADVVRRVARASRLAPDEIDDFVQSVHVRLLEGQYEIFRRFSGRSSLRTYLTVVVRRLLLDWLNASYGKWRPSAAAVRLGPAAVALERLIARDGYAPHEAIERLCLASGTPANDLEHLAARLPWRPRRRMVPLDELIETPGPARADAMFVDAVDEEQARLRRALGRRLRQLPAPDRALLLARYKDGHSVQQLARRLAVDPRQLYRRCDVVLRGLRHGLEADGFMRGLAVGG